MGESEHERHLADDLLTALRTVIDPELGLVGGVLEGHFAAPGAPVATAFGAIVAGSAASDGTTPAFSSGVFWGHANGPGSFTLPRPGKSCSRQ